MLNLFSRNQKESLDKGLQKTKEGFFSKLGRAVVGKSTIDDDLLDEVEEALISSDVGVSTTLKIIERIQDRVKRDKYLNAADLNRLLKEEIAGLMNSQDAISDPFEIPANLHPYVILVVGVNGVGKTTTIGKLAAQFKSRGQKVVLGAADTFRAAAVEQIKRWGERIGVPVVSKSNNADPASVAFDTLKNGQAENADVIIIDTAGRLHTKINLMHELGHIRRVMQKVIPTAPHEVLLVLDGSTGQNAVQQARAFSEATAVTSLAITKLDGTARGGVVLGIADEFKIPVKYIGVGEKVEDLQPFDKVEFVDSLFSKS